MSESTARMLRAGIDYCVYWVKYYMYVSLNGQPPGSPEHVQYWATRAASAAAKLLDAGEKREINEK